MVVVDGEIVEVVEDSVALVEVALAVAELVEVGKLKIKDIQYKESLHLEAFFIRI